MKLFLKNKIKLLLVALLVISLFSTDVAKAQSPETAIKAYSSGDFHNLIGNIKNNLTFLKPVTPIFSLIANGGLTAVDKLVPGMIRAQASNTSYASGWFAEDILIPVLTFMGMLLSLAVTLFAWIVNQANITTVLNNPSLYTIWAMIRDLMDIFLILVLLLSAFSTIFQIEKYNYKKVLLNLIFIALLINFSFVITKIIIDFSNIFMYTFLRELFPTAAKDGNVLGLFAMPLDPNNRNSISALEGIINPGITVGTSQLIAMIVFVFIMAVTFLFTSVLFIVRIVALAILLIFSPIAFAGSAIPGLSGKTNAFWDNLLKYSFFGPIMIFMIYIAVTFMKIVGANGAQSLTVTDASGNTSLYQIASAQSMDAGFIVHLSLLSIPIVVLWIGMTTAQRMSIAGASAVTGKATKFLGWAGRTLTGYRAAKWGIKAGAKKFDRDVLAKRNLSPRAWATAWKERTAELEKDKLGVGIAKARDTLGSVFDRGKRDPHFYEDMKKAELTAKYKKEQESVSTQDKYNLAGIKKLEGKKDLESQLRTRAFLLTMAENKDLNEYMKLRDKDVDPNDLRRDLTETLKTVGMSQVDIAKALEQIGNTAFMNGDYSKGGMAGRDENGNAKINSDEEQKAWVLGKIQNIPLQKFMIDVHPGTIITERGRLLPGETEENNGRGTPIESEIDPVTGNVMRSTVHDIGKGVLEYLDKIRQNDAKGEIPHANRIRGDVSKKWTHPNTETAMKKLGYEKVLKEFEKGKTSKTGGGSTASQTQNTATKTGRRPYRIGYFPPPKNQP